MSVKSLENGSKEYLELGSPKCSVESPHDRDTAVNSTSNVGSLSHLCTRCAHRIRQLFDCIPIGAIVWGILAINFSSLTCISLQPTCDFLDAVSTDLGMTLCSVPYIVVSGATLCSILTVILSIPGHRISDSLFKKYHWIIFCTRCVYRTAFLVVLAITFITIIFSIVSGYIVVTTVIVIYLLETGCKSTAEVIQILINEVNNVYGIEIPDLKANATSTEIRQYCDQVEEAASYGFSGVFHSVLTILFIILVFAVGYKHSSHVHFIKFWKREQDEGSANHSEEPQSVKDALDVDKRKKQSNEPVDAKTSNDSETRAKQEKTSSVYRCEMTDANPSDLSTYDL